MTGRKKTRPGTHFSSKPPIKKTKGSNPMQSPLRSQVSGRVGFAGAAGALISILMLSGCPGTLDPALFQTGTGGSGSGTGGSSSTGGSTGTGGSSANCTGSNDGPTLVTNQCAYAGCHDTADAQFSANLDLTVDSTISSRLVGVMAAQPAGSNQAACMNETEPLLVAGSNPATGLLVDKIKPNPPCGVRMPFSGIALSTMQQTCLIQWATTLTSP